jgi:fucose permease
MRWYYLLICAYVAVELGVAAWMVEYLQQERGFTVTGSSLCLSAFFSMIMLGRFFGSAFVERIGYVPIIGWSLMSMTAVLLIGLLGPNWLVWMLPASGLCMSIVFPTVTASVSNEHQSHLGSIFGILFACGGVGGASGPWTVGMISDWQGLRIGVLSILIYCLIALAAWLALVFTPGDRSPSS